MMMRIWLPSKRCPECRSIFVRWQIAPRFADLFQYWTCSDCRAIWPEKNGFLASELPPEIENFYDLRGKAFMVYPVVNAEQK